MNESNRPHEPTVHYVGWQVPGVLPPLFDKEFGGNQLADNNTVVAFR